MVEAGLFGMDREAGPDAPRNFNRDIGYVPPTHLNLITPSATLPYLRVIQSLR
jgi:hypothetical protein